MTEDRSNPGQEDDRTTVAAQHDRAVANAKRGLDDADEAYYRTHFESDPNRAADRRFEDVRAYYELGHSAAQYPDYRGREFDDIEADLRKGADKAGHAVDWTGGRSYARAAFARRRLATEGTLGGGAGNAANVAGGNVSGPRA